MQSFSKELETHVLHQKPLYTLARWGKKGKVKGMVKETFFGAFWNIRSIFSVKPYAGHYNNTLNNIFGIYYVPGSCSFYICVSSFKMTHFEILISFGKRTI